MSKKIFLNSTTFLLCVLALFCHQNQETSSEEQQSPALSQTPPGNNLSIPPELRLKHYRLWSSYPPNSRPLGADAPDLFDLPGYGGHKTGDINIKSPETAKVKNGSLFLPVTLDVHQPGTFHFETILYTKDHKPCLRSTTQAKYSKTGAAKVEFLFFGKTILDYCPQGPFYIKGILGRRVATAEEQAMAAQAGKAPEEHPLSPFRGTFNLKGFKNAQLSNKAWDSKIKRERIKRLLDEIAKKNVDKK